MMEQQSSSTTSKPWQFQPGQSGNPKGRPKGRKRKLSEKFIAALMTDFDRHGSEVIADIRLRRPFDYLKILASVTPRRVEFDPRPMAETIAASSGGVS